MLDREYLFQTHFLNHDTLSLLPSFFIFLHVLKNSFYFQKELLGRRVQKLLNLAFFITLSFSSWSWGQEFLQENLNFYL